MLFKVACGETLPGYGLPPVHSRMQGAKLLEVSRVCVCVWWQVVGPVQLCGNDLVEGLEQCDDGNTQPGDGCSPNCQVGSPRFIAPCLTLSSW